MTVRIGRIFFEHDSTRHELYVGVGEEIGGMVEGADLEDFELLKAALDPRVPKIISNLVSGDAHMMSKADWKLVDKLMQAQDDYED